MQITHPHTLLILAWLAIGQLCTGCSAEDIAGEAPSEMGVLCLQMSSDEDFVQVETRAVQTLEDWSGYTFKLNNEPISFSDGEAIIPAGTYTLSATNADAVDGGYIGALYSGSSEEFTITAGGTTPVTIALGAPKNAKVTISLSAKFTELYTFSSLTLKEGEEGEEGHTLTPDKQVAYFPATNTTLSYTLVANANKNSHVQDITGATGTVTIAPGKHTTLTLVVNPIDPNLVTIDTGTPYNGEFQ